MKEQKVVITNWRSNNKQLLTARGWENRISASTWQHVSHC
jgi:hypothetical protein